MTRTLVVVIVSLGWLVIAAPVHAQTSPGLTLFRGDGSSAYRPGSREWIA